MRNWAFRYQRSKFYHFKIIFARPAFGARPTDRYIAPTCSGCNTVVRPANRLVVNKAAHQTHPGFIVSYTQIILALLGINHHAFMLLPIFHDFTGKSVFLAFVQALCTVTMLMGSRLVGSFNMNMRSVDTYRYYCIRLKGATASQSKYAPATMV